MNKIVRGIISILLLILFFVCSFIALWAMLPSVKQYSFLSCSKYINAYEYSNDVNLEDSYYILNGIVVYKSTSSAKAEILMQRDVNYSSVSPVNTIPVLGINEIAISDNLMRREGYEIGDSVSFYVPMHDSREDYRISCVLDDVYGFLSEDVDKNYGVIVMGYNNEFVEQNSLDSVVFADDSFSASESDIELVNLYKKSNQLMNCRQDIIQGASVLAAVQLVILILAFAVYYAFSSQRMRKMYLSGADSMLIRAFVNRNYVATSIGPVLLAYVFLATFLVLSGVSCMWIMPLLLMSIVEICAMSAILRMFAKRTL